MWVLEVGRQTKKWFFFFFNSLGFLIFKLSYYNTLDTKEVNKIDLEM